jgi:hypothetical protein
VAEYDRKRGSNPNLPPPPATRDDSPASVNVPQMEPPPSSLQAMVTRSRSPEGSRSDTWIVVALVLLVLGVVAYLLRRGMA